MIPVTGVIHNNSAAWLQEDIQFNAIDLDFENHCASCPNDDHSDCWETDGSETLLIGFETCESKLEAWFEVGGTFYAVNEQAVYSAIVGETYTQVVKSRWAAECTRCSPCYPNQGDLDTPGTDYLAYCLPSSMFDEFDEFDISRIREW